MSTRTLFTFFVAAFLGAVAVGCASHRGTLDYYDRNVASGVQPVVEGSINNVSGYFVIDTGCMVPMLSQRAVEHCGISATPSGAVAVGIDGTKTLMEATDVTVRLGRDYAVYWRHVAVLPERASSSDATNDVYLGVLGYQFFAKRRAVMDMKHKTITLTK